MTAARIRKQRCHECVRTSGSKRLLGSPLAAATRHEELWLQLLEGIHCGADGRFNAAVAARVLTDWRIHLAKPLTLTVREH